jgi:hypothetical protein
MSATLRLHRCAANTAGILCRDGCEVHGNRGGSTALAPALVLLDARSLRGTRHSSREPFQAVGRSRGPPWPPPQAVASSGEATERAGRPKRWGCNQPVGRELHTSGDS